MFRGHTKLRDVAIRMNFADRREHDGGQNSESKAAEYVGRVASMQHAPDESTKPYRRAASPPASPPADAWVLFWCFACSSPLQQ